MDVVTGASGLLGNVLVRELCTAGREVRAFVRKTSKLECIRDCRAETVFGDVLDSASLTSAFKGAENVYHLASEISIMPWPDKNLQEVNITGTKNVIKACLECKVKRLIYTSSIHAFREPQNGSVMDEKLPLDIGSRMGQYNRTKAAATKEVLEAAGQGLDAVVACPTAIVGPYDFKVSNLGNLIINCYNRRQKIILEGAYDFVDVRDVAAGHMFAAQNGRKGQMYILSGQRLTISELMALLQEITGVPSPRFRLPDPVAYAVSLIMPVYYKLFKVTPVFTIYSYKTVKGNSFISHNKATEELGYSPRPIKQTIMDNIEWFRENRYL